MSLKRNAIAIVASVLCLAAQLPSQAAGEPQRVILKLDDVGAYISPQWQRVTSYLEDNGIKAGFGIICFSLEKDNPKYFAWIKERREKGFIDFWLHGYKARTAKDKGEFEEGSFEEQKAVLERSEALAKEKLGFEFAAFGPHWSGTTEETEKALQAIPEIKLWLYGPAKSKNYSKASLVRVLGLENPTFVPDFDKFAAAYEKSAKDVPVLVLQGHPNQWDEKRWEGFVKIVEFLKSKGCVFITPSDYLKSLEK